jgi:tetratricopeptide (TPR) repeat protein
MHLDESLQSALAQHRAGNLRQAAEIYQRILLQNRDHPEALHLLGLIARQTGQQDAAIGLINRAIALRPEFAQAHYNLGNILAESGKHEQSIASHRRAVELKPDFAEAYCSMGNALCNLGRLDEAIAMHQRAIELNPQFPVAHNDLGNVLVEKGLFDQAVASFQMALRLDPKSAASHYNLGNVLLLKGQPAHAAAFYNVAIQLDPMNAEFHHNLGIALRGLSRFDESLASYQRAIALKPNDPVMRWHLAMALLMAGDFEKGWEEFEWRLKHPGMRLNRGFGQSQWDGSDLAGKTLLLHAEGGFGDALQFIRLLPDVTARGGRFFLECQSELITLFSDLPGIEKIIPRGAALPEFDLHIPLQGLPRVLKIRMENIPSQVPYLKAPKDRAASWAARLADHQKLRVGLCWAGSGSGKDDIRTRSLEIFAPLADVPGVQFFSLQIGPESHQPPPTGMDWIDVTPELNDFADTAALVQNLDLVISVDTSIAHLAGALAVPVWVLIPFICDFRWFRNRTDSPWYPTMRLFRQPPGGEWNQVIQSLADALREMASKPKDRR